MGEGFYVLLAIAIGLYLLVGPGLGIAAFFRSDRGAALQPVEATPQAVLHSLQATDSPDAPDSP